MSEEAKEKAIQRIASAGCDNEGVMEYYAGAGWDAATEHHAKELAELKAKFERLAAWVNELERADWTDGALMTFKTGFAKVFYPLVNGSSSTDAVPYETPLAAVTAYLDGKEKGNG